MDKWDIQNITEMITWLGFFSAIFFAYYYYLRFRNKERILLIEKNVDLSEIYKKSERRFPWFLVGFSLLGLGVGIAITIVISLILDTNGNFDDDFIPGIVISGAVVFGAIGIILGHWIEQKKKAIRG